MGWGEVGKPRKSLVCKFLKVDGVPRESIPTDFPCSWAFPGIHWWPQQRCFSFSWGSGHSMAYTEVALGYTLIKQEKGLPDYASAEKWRLLRYEDGVTGGYTRKLQKWMVGYRREACMMAKYLDKFLSVCWEQCSCNIQVTVADQVLLLLLSPFALSLNFFFHKSSQPASGGKANWPL